MTRPCGCGGNAIDICNCVLVPGANTTVTGTGTPEDPYVVAAGATQVAVTDTPTIDLTLAVNGSNATPWNISAAVNRDPAGANLLELTASGLLVDCADVQDCVGETIGVASGLEYNTATNQLAVNPSSDPGNIILFGTDGGLYANPGGTVLPTQPRTRIGRTTFLDIPDTVATVVPFDATITDIGAMHTIASRMTCTLAGGHNVGATLQWFGNATGFRAALLRLNGTTFIAADQRSAAGTASTIVNVSTQIDLAVGDYVEVLAQHTAGAPLRLLQSPNFTPTAWMYYTTEGT